MSSAYVSSLQIKNTDDRIQLCVSCHEHTQIKVNYKVDTYVTAVSSFMNMTHCSVTA
jgi:hypothetical protein